MRRPASAVIGVLAVHNLTQNYLLNQRGYVSGNLVVSSLLAGLARMAGVSWEEMGLDPNRLRHGLRLGARLGWIAAPAGILVFAHPATRPYLLDRRAEVASRGEMWGRALVRFPLGTALFEEMAFRGVLPALLRTRRPAAADLLSAGFFALWHIIPTARALAGNPLGEGMPRRRRAAVVVTGSVVAGLFGLVFSALRERSGSLAAPWLAHASLNTVSFLTATAATRLAGSGHRMARG